jgi:hypothetical protein
MYNIGTINSIIYDTTSSIFINNMSVNFNIDTLLKFRLEYEKLDKLVLSGRKSRVTKMAFIKQSGMIGVNQQKQFNLEEEVRKIDSEIEKHQNTYKMSYLRGLISASMLKSANTQKQIKKATSSVKSFKKSINSSRKSIFKLRHRQSSAYNALNILLNGIKFKYFKNNTNIIYKKHDVNDIKKILDNILINLFESFFNSNEIIYNDTKMTHAQIGEYISNIIDDKLNKKLQTGGASHFNKNMHNSIIHNSATITIPKATQLYSTNKTKELSVSNINITSKAFINVFENVLNFIDSIKSNSLFKIEDVKIKS